ncbi:MAG: class 1 fructose-bisphosphatase [Candidatus Pacebacteria bacterium]|nr:class 1 fructose-bisphosphatase [Candidatus Paceibacterota bacterium]PIR60585.1 MAG: class 1 fructose-bisphosphatase [Candidatus Pacebacteria bacterium CG10_big_fil_rev_8_21_14_0_10_44_54]
MKKITNLTNFLFEQHTHSKKSTELGNIISQIVLATKIVSREINRAGLVDILGKTDKINIQKEEVQKLDELANTTFTELLRQSPHVAAVGSEEVDNIVVFTDKIHHTAEYIVHIDPLDGSSNIDVNVSVGTNFVIFKRKSKSGKLQKSDYLQAGKNAICAGYIVYGSSTMLVFSSGKGVHGFTLDPSIGEFLLSHENIHYPAITTIYSVNESYEPKWNDAIKHIVSEYKTSKNHSGKPLSARYIGSLVADFHRNLLKGGIFLYPADNKNPNGKLRLLYEGIPFAFLTQQAGGYSSNGRLDVLEIQPRELHQRIPFFVGTKNEVKHLEKLLC